jgi:HlyD family type I secretion membrane fusion protein
MSLSEKTKELADAPVDAADPGDAVAGTAGKSRGSLIERWDALERKLAARQSTSPAPAPAPGTTPSAPAGPGGPAHAGAAEGAGPLPVNTNPNGSRSAAIDDRDGEALLQDVASTEDASPAESANNAAPEERHPRPAGRRSGYTNISFNMSYGGHGKAGRPQAGSPAPAGAPVESGHATAPAARPGSEHEEPQDHPDVRVDSARASARQKAEAAAPEADRDIAEVATGAEETDQPTSEHRAPEDARPEPQGASSTPADSIGHEASEAAEGRALSPAEGHELVATEDTAKQPEVASEHQLQAAAGGAGATLQAAPPADEDPSEVRYGRSIVTGLLLLLLGVGGFVAWAALAPIASGVVAGGSIKLEGERKVVQHLEGGIIRELMITEGEPVKAGQVLLRLDGSRAKAVLEVTMADYLSQLARRSRLISERRGLEEVEFDPEILARADDPRVKELMETERGLFADRRASHQDQLNIFSSWAEGHKREIAGLRAQRAAAQKQLVHINDELQSVQTLYEKGVVAKTRLLELKRTAAGLNGQTGALTAEISRAEQKIGEAELRAVSLHNERAQEISDALTAVENSIRRLKEQIPAQVDVVERLEVKAPSDGRVVNLRYHTVGGVINAATPILDIVPGDARLVIEAHVAPIDIEVLKPGMAAQITLSAYNQRSTPPIPGSLIQVSADRIDETNGESYYKAMVDIDREALAALPEVKLYPGMPAQVQFVGGERTPMDYLLAPIEAGLRKAWLEE